MYDDYPIFVFLFPKKISMPNIRLSIHKYCKIDRRKTSTKGNCQQANRLFGRLADRMFPIADEYMEL